MGLISQQAVIAVQVEWSDYDQIDSVIRAKLLDYPDCRIISMNSVRESFGAWFFVTIETI